MTKYFGLAFADGMLAEKECVVKRTPLTEDQVREEIKQGVEPCLNPFHTATVNAMKKRYGFNVAIPETAPKVQLKQGDSLVVMSIRGLPRLTESREYTDQEVANAGFEFSKYEVILVADPT